MENQVICLKNAFSSFPKHYNFPKQTKPFDDIFWYLSYMQIGNLCEFNRNFIHRAFQILPFLVPINGFFALSLVLNLQASLCLFLFPFSSLYSLITFSVKLFPNRSILSCTPHTGWLSVHYLPSYNTQYTLLILVYYLSPVNTI